MKKRILVCGHGKMGKVHLNSLNTLDPDGSSFEIAVIDSNPETLISLNTKPGIKTYNKVEDALAFEPEIIIMAFNDAYHLDAYKKLLTLPSVKGVVGEKPFCRTAEEARELENYFTGKSPLFLSINTIINYSSIFDMTRETLGPQLAKNKVIAIDCAWGKDRTKDPRPTAGIISDLTHPLGVLSDALGFDKITWQSGTGKRGYLADKAPDVTWAFNEQNLIHENIPITLEASFGWKDQHRRVTVYYETAEKKIQALEYNFDLRETDGTTHDTATLYDIDLANGKAVKRVSLSTKDAPMQNKALNFMQTSLRAYEAHKNAEPLPEGITNYSRALHLQDILWNLETRTTLTRQGAHPDSLNEPTHLPLSTSCDPVALSDYLKAAQRISSQTAPSNSGYNTKPSP